ncbi:MAG: hypothetical protein ACJA1V_000766, partial [Flavobacteriaceae bacterium]
MVGILLFLGLTTFLFSLNSVQTFLASRLTKSLNNSYGIDLQIAGVEASIFRLDIKLNGVLAADYKKDTLFYAKNIQAPILDFNALRKGNFGLGKVKIVGLRYKIITYKDSLESNWDVFLTKLESQNPAAVDSKPFALMAKEIDVSEAAFELIDYN